MTLCKQRGRTDAVSMNRKETTGNTACQEGFLEGSEVKLGIQWVKSLWIPRWEVALPATLTYHTCLFRISFGAGYCGSQSAGSQCLGSHPHYARFGVWATEARRGGSVGFPGATGDKDHVLPIQETQENGPIPGSGWSPEEGMAAHNSILAWRIPWIGKPGGLQSMGSQESDTTEWPSTHSHMPHPRVSWGRLRPRFPSHRPLSVSPCLFKPRAAWVNHVRGSDPNPTPTPTPVKPLDDHRPSDNWLQFS